MNKTFKKVAASVMTVVSLSACVTGFNTNASEVMPLVDGTVIYGGCTCSIYVNSTQANAGTTSTSYKSALGVAVGNIEGTVTDNTDSLEVATNTKGVWANIYGVNFEGARSTHSTPSGNQDLVRYV